MPTDTPNFSEKFSLRILYKPETGVLWGYNNFWVKPELFSREINPHGPIFGDAQPGKFLPFPM